MFCASIIGPMVLSCALPDDGDDRRGVMARHEVVMAARVIATSVSRDRIACLHSTGAVSVLDLVDGRLIRAIEKDGGLPSAIAISPDGGWVAICGISEMADIGPPGANFDGPLIPPGVPGAGRGSIASGEENFRRLQYKVPPRPPIMHAVGLTRPRGGFVMTWSLQDGQMVGSRADFPLPILGIANDGSRMAIVDENFNVRILDNDLRTTRSVQNNLRIQMNEYPAAQIVFDRSLGRIACLTAGSDGRISVISCDIGGGRTIMSDRVHEDSVPWAIAHAPDGRTFVTSGPGSDITLWDSKSGRRLKTIGSDDKGEGNTLYLAFNIDSNAIVAMSTQGFIRVIDQESGRTILSGRGPKSDVRAAILSDDHLAVASGAYRQVGKNVDPLVLWKIKLYRPATP